MKTPFFTMEDAKIAFNLFCFVYGIGTLGMPGNFARSGPVIAVVALVFMAVANIYASVVCSKVMLAAPRSVKTYGDLGEWCMGKYGRVAVIVSQISDCYMLACAFLVLGGNLLTNIFPGSFGSGTWIFLMSVVVAPLCLVPTMKESAGIAFAGALGTIIAVVIGVATLLHGMSGHPSVPASDISFKQISIAFGNLSLAYGAGAVIPALQRQHSDPERMPRVVFITLGSISVLFLIMSYLAYSAVGCQISDNLLFMIYNDAVTGVSALGFRSNQGAIVLAYLCMQMHVTVAAAIAMHPTFYVFERLLLGMHKPKAAVMDAGEDLEAVTADYENGRTPNDNNATTLDVINAEDKQRSQSRRSSRASIMAAHLKRMHEEEKAHEEAELAEYKGHTLKWVILRIVMLAILVTISIVLRDHFNDLADFVGASAITVCCVLLPIAFYLKALWPSIPLYEKVGAILIVVVCTVFGAYVTYQKGVVLFGGAEHGPKFPYCYPEYQTDVYYLKP